jgi:hypothetical protein
MCAKRNFTPLNSLLFLMPKPAALRDCLMPEPAFSIFRLGRAAGAIAATWLATGLAGTALAADPGKSAGGIYTCVDAYGRRITSDRPIPECMDREQRQLSSSGVTRRVLRPEPTVSQLKEQKAKAEQAKQRLQEQENQRQRDIALAIRYPNLEAHAKARRDALEPSQLRMGLIEKRLQALQQERDELQKRLDSFADPQKIPPYIKRNAETNQKNLEAQERAMANEQEERRLLNARFDDELARLKNIWHAQEDAP